MRESKPYWMALQGQSGVAAVCAQLLLRAHVPCVPMVDYGFDLILDNGLKLQIKTARLSYAIPRYKDGHYRLIIKEWHYQQTQKEKLAGGPAKRRVKRDWAKICDFFVYWCIDENRFFVIPREEMLSRGSYAITPVANGQTDTSREKIQQMVEMGMTIREISVVLGVHYDTVYRRIYVPEQRGTPAPCISLLQYENAWHLLNVDGMAKAVIESLEQKAKV